MSAAGERWGGSGSAACACTTSTDDDRRSQCGGGHDKHGSLLGFATTDEIGSVMDMTKRRKTKTGSGVLRKSQKSQGRQAGMNPRARQRAKAKAHKTAGVGGHASSAS